MIKKKLGSNSYFIGEKFEVGENFSIGNNTIIRAKKFKCGNNVTIGDDNNILVGEKFILGDCSYIGHKNEITGLNIVFGSYLYLDSNVIIGHGGKMNYDSKIHGGNSCMICSYVKLNINYRIDLGNNVGIGENVDVWTHGSFLSVLDGYPAQFGRVSIGSNVWLPAKSTVLPNVTIGDNVVIGVNSVINKNLPKGSLCAGIPVKIIRENIYPKIISTEEKINIINNILNEYKKLLVFKEIKILNLKFNEEKFILIYGKCTFNFNDLSIKGELEEEEEDLRDFLRRKGIKIYTGKPFKSILPKIYKNLLNINL